MPKRRPSDLPSLKRNRKKEFYIHDFGRKIYMGKDVSTAKTRLLEYIQNRDKHVPTVTQKKCTVAELMHQFFLTISKNNSHYSQIKKAVKLCYTTYGEKFVDDFGPIALKKIREILIAEDLSRDYINKTLAYIRNIFRFGVENEMVQEVTLARLERVKNLQPGEAKENPPREDVPDEHVLATLPWLLPTLRDMVILQRISGMRPSEVFRLTMDQVDTSQSDVWVYLPDNHKTKRLHKKRVVALGKFEMEILKRRSASKKPSEPIFSPRDTVLEMHRHHGHTVGDMQCRHINATYSRYAYRNAVKRAIEKANLHGNKIPHWTPYQLRHASATFLSFVAGEEVAATTLGHTNLKTTARYDHSAIAKAIRAVKERDAKAGVDMAKWDVNIEN